MTITTTLRFAAAGLIAAGALSPVALAGGEPKNDWPFTRAVVERTTAQVQRSDSGVLVAQGESKNQQPFTRTVTDIVAFQIQSTAAVRPDDRAGIRGVGADVTSQPSTAVRPDDRAGIRGIGADLTSQPSTAARPDNRPGPLGVGAVDFAPIGSGDGFDWGAWGIGLAAGFGAALALAGGLLMTHRLPRRIGAAAAR